MEENKSETARDSGGVKSNSKDETNGACSSPEDQKVTNKGTSERDQLTEAGKEVEDCCNGEIYKRKDLSGEQKVEDVTGSSSENDASEMTEVSKDVVLDSRIGERVSFDTRKMRFPVWYCFIYYFTYR